MANIDLCKSHVRHFAIALIVSKILIFQICHLENVGQCHGVQHSLWSYSMANINIYTRRTGAFFASFHGFRDNHFKIRDLENVGEGHDVQHSQWLRSMANT